MNYTQEAIQRAGDAGFKDSEATLKILKSDTELVFKWAVIYKILLTPDFWQCLGKSLGWKEKVCDLCGSGDFLRGYACFGGDPERGAGIVFHAGSERAYQPKTQPPEWLFHWHRLIDHLAEGHDIESFFKNLLSNK